MTTQPEDTLNKQIETSFLEVFRKTKGIYSQNDVEKIVKEALSEERTRIREKVDGMKKKGIIQHIPCPDNKPGCLVYHTKMVEGELDKEYNQAIKDVLEALEEQKEKQ